MRRASDDGNKLLTKEPQIYADDTCHPLTPLYSPTLGTLCRIEPGLVCRPVCPSIKLKWDLQPSIARFSFLLKDNLVLYLHWRDFCKTKALEIKDNVCVFEKERDIHTHTHTHTQTSRQAGMAIKF